MIIKWLQQWEITTHPNMQNIPLHGGQLFSACVALIPWPLIQSSCLVTSAYTPGKLGRPQPIPHDTTPTTYSKVPMVNVRGPPLSPWHESIPFKEQKKLILICLRRTLINESIRHSFKPTSACMSCAHHVFGEKPPRFGYVIVGIVAHGSVVEGDLNVVQHMRLTVATLFQQAPTAHCKFGWLNWASCRNERGEVGGWKAGSACCAPWQVQRVFKS